MLRIALLALWGCGLVWGQAADLGLNFEVASVKLAAPAADGRVVSKMGGGPETSDPGQINYTSVTLKDVLMKAYDVRTFQVTGPTWIETERYDIVAKLPADATKEQLNVMLQHVLTERFHVVLHREAKEFTVYEMVLGKNGTKLKETSIDPNAAVPAGPVVPQGGPKMDASGFPMLDRAGMILMRFANKEQGSALEMRVVARAQPLSALTERIETEVKMPVIDRTGLKGKFDFTLEYSPAGAVVPARPEGVDRPLGGPEMQQGPPIESAVQEQLGLRLEKKKAPLDILVIDGADKAPSEN